MHVVLALHCVSSIMESSLGTCRKGGGYLQREKADKMRKLQTTQPSGLAQYMVLNFTTSRCPTPKNKVMSLLKSLRTLGFV